MIYACNLAQGDGTVFAATLAEITRADVAVSTNATGASRLGGDWSLEWSSGTIEASTMASGSFDGLLTAPVVVGPSATTSVTEPSTLNAAGADQVTLSGWTIADDGVGGTNVTVKVTLPDALVGTLSDPGAIHRT